MRALAFALLAFVAVLLLPASALAQGGVLRGTAIDAFTQEPLAGVNIAVVGTERGATTDLDGAFVIDGLAASTYALRATYVGYEPLVVTDLAVNETRATVVTLRLRESAVELAGVTVEARSEAPPAEAPTSVRVLGAEEIRRAPGGLNDISRSLLSLPGVTGGADNRNDLTVRGGGPSENAYYLDGIRIPQINHFATQGATGGATGLLNPDFISEAEFFTGGFPVRYGDALSSVLRVESRPGTPDRVAGDFTLGATEAALTFDGPIGRKTTWLASVRRSYLQILFSILDLPIRPNYWDAQLRVQTELSPRDRLTFVGIGALDRFGLALPDSSDTFESRETALRVTATNDSDLGALGAAYRRLIPQGVATLSVSATGQRFRFGDTSGEDGAVTLDNRSTETDLRATLDIDRRLSRRLSTSVGAGIVRAGLDTRYFEAARPGSTFPTDVEFEDALAFAKLFAYGQLQARSFGGRLTTTAGLRADEATVLDRGFSLAPRLSAQLSVTPALTLSAAAGQFYQTPALLSLGVRDATGARVNRALRPIRADQIVGGIAYVPAPGVRLSLEGFAKRYARYPVSIADPRVSLANLGSDYGAVGAEPLAPTGTGRAYGVEAFAQRRLLGRTYGLLAYTLAWSEFAGADGQLRPSAWDVRHTLSASGGIRLGQRWELSSKIRVLSGRPYTPFDPVLSAEEYRISGNGVPDIDRLNALRAPAYVRLDVRVDRTWRLGPTSGVVYLDVQNVTNRTNVFGFRYTEDPAFPDNRRPIDNVGLLPNFGFSVEF